MLTYFFYFLIAIFVLSLILPKGGNQSAIKGNDFDVEMPKVGQNPQRKTTAIIKNGSIFLDGDGNNTKQGEFSYATKDGFLYINSVKVLGVNPPFNIATTKDAIVVNHVSFSKSDFYV